MMDDYILISTNETCIKINGALFTELHFIEMPEGEVRVICKDENKRSVMFKGFHSMRWIPFGSVYIMKHFYSGNMVEEQAKRLIGR